MKLSNLFMVLIMSLNVKLNMAAEENLLTVMEEKFQLKLSEYTNNFAKWLEDFNDRHLLNSDIGRIIRYDVLKPKFGAVRPEGRNMKKMSMALIPLVFHVGATSTWMLLTSIMAAKSVAIGIALLVFKIAVSSAKVASFFTALKAKHGLEHHHDWSPSWTPHFEHHGHGRSLNDLGQQIQSEYSSYLPEHHEHIPYKTIPSYKSHETHEHEEIAEYGLESKKVNSQVKRS